MEKHLRLSNREIAPLSSGKNICEVDRVKAGDMGEGRGRAIGNDSDDKFG